MESYKRFIVFFVCVVVGCSVCCSGTIKFARYPHICNGKIAFTYQDDIWVANDDGSEPRRLTNHVARDLYPRFSPDGKWIAFSSDRMGNYDIYVVPVQGGTPTQLTFYTGDDTMVNWTPDGKRIIFRTSRIGTWASPLYTVSCDGDLPMPLNIDAGYTGSISHDGKYLAFNRKGVSYGRKHYKGNSNSDIWLQDLRSRKITQLTDTEIKKFRSHTNDLFPMWGADGRIYFASERDDTFNIWSMPSKKGSAKQITFHKTDGVHYPAISPDGTTIIYENEFELWKLTVPDGKPEKIAVEFGYEPKENMVVYVRVDSKADGFASSPKGDYAAIDYHGEIFIVPTEKEVGEKKQVTSSGNRDRYSSYSPDGKYLAYISDKSDDEEIWLYDIEQGSPRQLTTHQSAKRQYLWSDDSKQIVWTAANKIFISDVEDARVNELAHNDAGGFKLTDLSKDCKWIVYTRSRDDYNQDVYLFNVDTKEEFNITDNPFYDSNGVFSDDEKSLIFTSTRISGSSRLFVVPFEKITEDRNDPLLKEKNKAKKAAEKSAKKTGPAKSTDPNEPAKEAADKEQPVKEKKALKLDMDGIDRRAIQLTKKSSDVGNVFVVKSKIYFTARENNAAGLFSIGIDGQSEGKVTDGSFGQLDVSADRKMLLYKSGSNVYKMPLSSKKKEKIVFNVTVAIDKQEEWTQIFEECWRVMKYYFYDENMHGYDWDAIKSQYKPLLSYVSDYKDVYDLANLMIGELNASHTGVSGPTKSKPTTYKTKFLGFEMIPEGRYYKVSHIHWKGPADKEWIDLNVGDYVLSIDGKKITVGDNYWQILNHCLNEYVTVEVSSAPADEDVRQLRIKTVTSLRNIKYEEWVETNRKYVEEKTDDKIAYVHIRAMDRPSLERFRNEINRYHNHKGIIVDIRFNRGGNIDQELLDILTRRAYEFWNNRWSSREMGRRHRQAIIGPKVMLINSGSASNSEVTPLGFQDLGLGTVVGNPTVGAVIATGSYRLINGATIRRPGALVVTYDPTQPNNYGINLENYGVAPDVWVENSPEDVLARYDRELETAVEQAMKMLKKQQAEIKAKK